MKMRVPATPIINIDPYFSIWADGNVNQNFVHWTGKPNSMNARVFIDGTEYHLLGGKTRSERDVIADMLVENVEIDAFSTIITSSNDAIRMTVHFTSPTLVDDLYYASRPVAYCKISYENLDGKEHDVTVRFKLSEELVLNTRGEGRALGFPVAMDNMTCIKMGNGIQRVLRKSGDDIRIDWGYVYMAVNGEAVVGHAMLGEMYAITLEKNFDKTSKEALFLFAYDDIESIQYFGENLKAYWKKDGKTIEEAMTEAAAEYDTLLARCNAFSDKIRNEAIEKGNEKYAEILLLAVRQVMAAHKLVVDKNGNNLYISKECFSNGCAATVDVTYPSAPLFLLYNPELLKAMLRPVMDYAASEEWIYDFAPHDVGQYPLLNGQVYGVKRSTTPVTFHYEGQMPVEECGNMIILFSAICDAEDDVTFAKAHIDTIRQWNEYLIRYGLDPENQLCTDDFAGHLAHNVNLSIKAIMGIVAYSRILTRLGETKEASEMMDKAREYVASLLERAVNSDGSYRLAYDKPETFSLKYNAIWDKIWGTNLFPEEFFKGEMARYKKEMLPYGVPLDSRETYTKSDWLVWVASFADNKEDFTYLVDSLWSAYNTMRTRVPMTDWYFCDIANMRGFQHRTVQGGLFIRFMLD